MHFFYFVFCILYFVCLRPINNMSYNSVSCILNLVSCTFYSVFCKFVSWMPEPCSLNSLQCNIARILNVREHKDSTIYVLLCYCTMPSALWKEIEQYQAAKYRTIQTRIPCRGLHLAVHWRDAGIWLCKVKLQKLQWQHVHNNAVIQR